MSADAALGVLDAKVVNGHALLALGVNAHWVSPPPPPSHFLALFVYSRNNSDINFAKNWL